eukprot:CAMPEP_0204624898 /NCGR_PEP_ID=MMETSP0717-20131115/10661_1 /ASSEMBLY_ACC=CAM_ASM_000666 /TAXON_ID=230516 /ORGANISM="Chaetoceros curvisetus" /LENGTH=135 /DNA_ID=CAMNT_0051640447 /DNA_START=115 /DNA_END=522 /DNA_ORIENTATION=-
MGAVSSTPTQAEPSIEQSSSSIGEKRMTAEEMQLRQIAEIPTYKAPETFDEKLYRKFSKEPLVPIGCLTTAYFLASGIRSFYDRDAIKSQKMMRLRVGAQFGTLLIFIGYAGLNAINFDVAPGYHPKDDKKDRQQ